MLHPDIVRIATNVALRCAAQSPLTVSRTNIARNGGTTYPLDVRQDAFVHFTLQSRVEEILKAGKLAMHPGYQKFGPDAVYAISTTFGILIPRVQMTHLDRHRDPEDVVVAILFKTPTIPEIAYIEEVIWNQDVVLMSPRVLSKLEGCRYIVNTPAKLLDGDVVMYEPQYAG